MRILAIMLALVVVLSLKLTPPKPPVKWTVTQAEEIWHLTLPEAIRAGLENQEVIQFINTGATEIPNGIFEPTRPRIDHEDVGRIAPDPTDQGDVPLL